MTIALSVTDASEDKAGDVVATLGYARRSEERIVNYPAEPERNNMTIDGHQMLVRDVRTADVPAFDPRGLKEAGFAYLKHDGTLDINEKVFEDNLGNAWGEASPATQKYLAETAEFIRKQTGAREVLPQVRGILARASNRSKVPSFYKPAGYVHIDYTPDYAEKQIPLAASAAGREVKPYSRFVLYQTWRAISKGPQDAALAVCDERSATLAEDGSLLYSIFGPEDVEGNVIHTRLPEFAPAHEWYYLSNMEPDDLLIFPAYDTNKPIAMSAMHVGFDNPLVDGIGEPRRSIEARFVALFD